MALKTCNRCGLKIIDKTIDYKTKFCGKCGAIVLINPQDEALFLTDIETTAKSFQSDIKAPSQPNRNKILFAATSVFALICLSAVLYYYISSNPILNPQTSNSIKGNYPEGSTRLLTEEELKNYRSEDLGIMRNEIYARKGFIFGKEALKNYFNQQTWYRPTLDNSEQVYNLLSAIEKNNIALIKKVETDNIANAKITMESKGEALRVRQEPNDKTIVIDGLKLGELAEYLNEIYYDAQGINVNGRHFVGNWYKIKTARNHVGWVHEYYAMLHTGIMVQGVLEKVQMEGTKNMTADLKQNGVIVHLWLRDVSNFNWSQMENGKELTFEGVWEDRDGEKKFIPFNIYTDSYGGSDCGG